MKSGNEDFDLLKELLGNEEAYKVAKAFGGARVYFPKNVVTTEVHRRIRKEFKAGATYRALSIRYGYSESHIRNIVHKNK